MREEGFESGRWAIMKRTAFGKSFVGFRGLGLIDVRDLADVCGDDE